MTLYLFTILAVVYCKKDKITDFYTVNNSFTRDPRSLNLSPKASPFVFLATPPR